MARKAASSAKKKTSARKPSAKSDARKASSKDARKSAKNISKVLKTKPKRGWKFRFFKWAVILGLIVCLVPALLTLIYAPSSVRPISTLMVSQWFKGAPVKRIWVPFKNISPFVYQSVISSEDGKFCTHDGVDWDAVNLVVDDLIEGERPRGASTIPMQTVKNVFLWNSRSFVRKGLEVPLALFTDLVWSKRRMMEIYLNIAEWGPGIYGIEAAAQHHFGRSARNLTRRQAAYLAVTLPNPKLRNPRKPSRGMKRLARLVERRAKASGAYVRCLKEKP